MRKAFSILTGLASLAVFLQGVWAGLFLEHDGGRDAATRSLALHNGGAIVAVLLALAAAIIATMALRDRRDLWYGSILLFVLLVIETELGELIHHSGKDALTVVHIPLALALMGLCVWLPMRVRAGAGSELAS